MAVPEAGNRYVFTTQPTLTFTSTDVAKTYGQDVTATVAGAYAVTGFVNAALYGNVVTQDTVANAVSGTPAVTSLGSPAAAPVVGSPYAINVNTGGVTSPTGYAIAASSAGQLTVNPAGLTVTADNQSKTYGQTVAFDGTEFTSAGAAERRDDRLGDARQRRRPGHRERRAAARTRSRLERRPAAPSTRRTTRSPTTTAC